MNFQISLIKLTDLCKGNLLIEYCNIVYKLFYRISKVHYIDVFGIEFPTLVTIFYRFFVSFFPQTDY